MLNTQIKKQFGSWRAYAKSLGENESNFHRKMDSYIGKINKWLEPLGMEIKIVKK